MDDEHLKSITLSLEARLYVEKYIAGLNKIKKNSSEQTIKVSQVLGSIAFLYERVRNAVDYKGEHLLRRSAIERILKRQLWEKKDIQSKAILDTLIGELTWARYLKNESFSHVKESRANTILARYLEIFQKLSGNGDKKFKEWLIGIASCELEEVFDESLYFTEILGDAVFSWFKKNYRIKENNISEEEQDIQIYIAIQKSISKLDDIGIRYRLLKLYMPGWVELNESNVSGAISEIQKNLILIDTNLDSPIQSKIYRYVQKQSAAFLVLKDIVDENPDGALKLFKNPIRLEKKIKSVCSAKYAQIQKKISTGIRRSIVYIFLTKAVLAFMIEIPYEYFFIGSLNYVSLTFNTLFPPVLMFIVGLSIKKPDEENTQRIISKIKHFIYPHENPEIMEFSVLAQKSTGIAYRIFSIFYLLLFIITFGGIAFLLTLFDFNVISIGVFFVFLSLVLLFAYRVRYTATELNVSSGSEGFLSHLFSDLTLPLLNLGFWLSRGFKRFNFLLIFMDFLVETPLKKIIKVFEEWTGFIREKKEEVVEVPN